MGKKGMHDRERQLVVLTEELSFLERGGYRSGPRYPWRPKFVFEDSPTCVNLRTTEDRGACTNCALMDFVPEDYRQTRFPCRHIHLTDKGETLNAFYEWGTEEELESALRNWLKQKIKELEFGEKVRSQLA
jgi:hypothetical protein